MTPATRAPLCIPMRRRSGFSSAPKAPSAPRGRLHGSVHPQRPSRPPRGHGRIAPPAARLRPCSHSPIVSDLLQAKTLGQGIEPRKQQIEQLKRLSGCSLAGKAVKSTISEKQDRGFGDMVGDHRRTIAHARDDAARQNVVEQRLLLLLRGPRSTADACSPVAQPLSSRQPLMRRASRRC